MKKTCPLLVGRDSSSPTNHLSRGELGIGATFAPPNCDLILTKDLFINAPFENSSFPRLAFSAPRTSGVGASSKMTSRNVGRVFMRPESMVGATLNGMVIITSRAESTIRWAYQSSMLSALRGEKNSATGVVGTFGGLRVNCVALATAWVSVGSTESSSQ